MASPLRTRMVEQMKLRYLAPSTQDAYVKAVAAVAKFYRRSPDRLTGEQLQAFILHLQEEKHRAWSSLNVTACALRFFYRAVLYRRDLSLSIPPRRPERRLPCIISREEVQRILDAPRNVKHRTLLMTVYGGGLRVSELVVLKPHHIESSRKLIRVERGKGRKDRYTLLPDKVLHQLRRYWRMYEPRTWLFPGRDPNLPLDARTAQTVYYAAKKAAGVTRGKGIHTLRHCFATFLLEDGYSIYEVKEMLGHRCILTTMRYLHLTPVRVRSIRSPLDTAGQAG